MKKKYLKPEMEVYEVETPQLLAGSPKLYNEDPEDGNEEML
ncbi:MAG: hypothetical protein PUD56_05025 [Prevotella sp.]|nr:hypothetical protein [Prevotella sp.]